VTRRSSGPPENPDLTMLAAAKFVEKHGHEALCILDDRAETAAELGHQNAAKTWRALAEAAAELLRIERDSPVLPPTVARRLPRVWLR
jgi:hypothetical protein